MQVFSAAKIEYTQIADEPLMLRFDWLCKVQQAVILSREYLQSTSQVKHCEQLTSPKLHKFHQHV